jgi:hypothetical protein
VSAVAFAGVLAVAALLRFWRLSWGLDDGLWFQDEGAFWRRYLIRFTPLELSSFLPPRLTYPSLFGFLTGGAIWAAHGLGCIGQPDANLADAILVGRIVSALAGIATVVLVGILGARFYSARAAVAAAALLAVAPLEAMQVHYLSSDVLLGTCTAATCSPRGTSPAGLRSAPRCSRELPPASAAPPSTPA